MTIPTLTSGLLWHDNTAGKSLDKIIGEASDAYLAKYGIKPDTCLVYRGIASEPFDVNGIVAIPTYPLVHHLLIGVVKHDRPMA